MIGFVNVLCYMGVFLVVHGNERLMIDQLRWDFLMLEDKLWDIVLNSPLITAMDRLFGGNHPQDKTLIHRFYTFDKKIQQMPQDILYGLQVVRQVQSFSFLFSDLKVINDMYHKFTTHQESILQSKPHMGKGDGGRLISRITHDVLYDPNINIYKTVTSIFQKIFSNNDENIISKISDIISKSDYPCKNPNQSPQQVFYNLYNTIALVQLKGYMMVQFSYLALRLRDVGTSMKNVGFVKYVDLSLLAREEFQKGVSSMSPLRRAFDNLPGKVYRCDPKEHIKGVTYNELTALLQGYIENKADLNKRGTCTETCTSYSQAKSYGCYDRGSEHCRKRKPCGGRIYSCRFIESHMTTCISPVSSSRKYEYIQFKSGRVMGKEAHCQNININSWLRGLVRCSYCVCLCDDQGPLSDRYFNLRPVMADVANNRVVTGLRIIKHNRIIHLQIQEGKLLPYGYIDNSTIRWVPVDDYKITDWSVQNGKDFHTMSYEQRTMLLDDLKTYDADHIITGVRFEFSGNHLRFQIHVRGFDFKNGTLSSDANYIYGTQQRQKLDLHNSDVPTKSPKSIPNWSQRSYIEFTHTSFHKDAAQTTIPFFDTQPVAADPAVPLRGAGIYYKGFKGYGGFVAPKITTYDFSKRLTLDSPEPEPRVKNKKN